MNWKTNIPFKTSSHIDRSKPLFIPLVNMGLISVNGDEAATFLHSLLTNDIQNLKVDEARLCGLCSPKGRLLASLTVIKRGSEFLLILPTTAVDIIVKRLALFVLRSKVNISNLQQSHCCFALLNVEDADISQFEVSTNSKLIALPYLEKAYVSEVKEEDTDSTLSVVEAAGWQSGDDNEWCRKLIENGVPQIFEESIETFTPQQVNFDLINGVSFKKGCYPGQEVVARLHYLGSPSRRLCSATSNIKILPTPNSEVLDENGEVLGHIVQAAFVRENNEVILSLSLKLSVLGKPAYINGEAIDNVKLCVEETSS